MVKIAVRVDASVNIGSGHVMRCLSLSEALKNKGFDIVFVMRPQQGDMFDYVASRGFKTIKLMKPDKWLKPSSTSDYEAWLQVPLLEDVRNFLNVAADAELIVIDHYSISCEWERLVKNETGARIVVIDDLVREHAADLIIDQTFGRKASEYGVNNEKMLALTGTRFALLKKQFIELHQKAYDKIDYVSTHKILLSMGGIDNPNATLAVLEALSTRINTLQVTVLLNKQAPHFDKVKDFCERNNEWVTHLQFVEGMASLMLEHTVAIGAPGSTSWERACLGLPSILVPLAENQLQICENLVAEGAALTLALADISSQLNNTLDEILERYSEMRQKNLSLCDGRGCERVVEKFNQLGWI